MAANTTPNGTRRTSRSWRIQAHVSGIRVRTSRVGPLEMMATVEPILDPASARKFDLFYDYLCPFAYRASVLLQNVKDSGERPLDITWRYFSLVQVNSKVEGFTVWESLDSEARGRR